ncbi:MAG: hypothetical protein AB1414_00450 [bacterium]
MISKNILKLQTLAQSPYFTVEDLAESLGIKLESARVFCSRYVKKKILLKLKNNYYSSGQRWESNNRDEFLKIANILQVPSYISLQTALVYYEVTTQIQRNFFESVCLKRTQKLEIKDTIFNYYKLNKQYYFDFIKKDGIFIASKEKAFLDAMYLYSFGKYKLDFNALDFNKLEKTKIKKLIEVYPEKTLKIVGKLCKI